MEFKLVTASDMCRTLSNPHFGTEKYERSNWWPRAAAWVISHRSSRCFVHEGQKKVIEWTAEKHTSGCRKSWMLPLEDICLVMDAIAGQDGMISVCPKIDGILLCWPRGWSPTKVLQKGCNVIQLDFHQSRVAYHKITSFESFSGANFYSIRSLRKCLSFSEQIPDRFRRDLFVMWANSSRRVSESPRHYEHCAGCRIWWVIEERNTM